MSAFLMVGDRVRVHADAPVVEALRSAEGQVAKVGPLWVDTSPEERTAAFIVFDDNELGAGIIPVEFLERTFPRPPDPTGV